MDKETAENFIYKCFKDNEEKKIPKEKISRKEIVEILTEDHGIPVATVALNGAKNAGILAARIIGATDKKVKETLAKYSAEMKEKVEKSQEQID